MTVLLEADFRRTLDDLRDRLAEVPVGTKVEAWTFDDSAGRRTAEQALAARGLSARVRSAYKPLVHFFLEEVDRSALAAATIAYPVHPLAPPNRFLLEAYPLTALLDGVAVVFQAREDDGFHYDVALTFKDGRREEHRVAAPNRVHTDMAGETSVSPTGWLRLGDGEGGRLETDYERLYETAMMAIVGHGWTGGEPYFEELNIRAELPLADEPLGFADEVLSLREALHEDFYFSLLEVFQRKSGRPLGDRGLKPGQIAPEIVRSDGPGPMRVRVELRPFQHEPPAEAVPVPAEPLDRVAAPLTQAAIRAALERIGGEPFEAATRAGRRVLARHVVGSEVPVMISGGQHANETTGGAGALRAAVRLAARPGAHFTISPLENPDGYALHQRLRRDNPRHMHHAARYTALGDDLEYRAADNPDLLEKAIRIEAERRSGARLHLNLHGYPAHEWTRPLSGYVPRGFAMWTLPKGFFLILRHHAGWEDAAERLLDRVTRHLGGVPGVMDRNAAQIALCETHAGETGFRIVNGFPCLVSQDERSTVPVTLLTEYPDQTIYGDAFIAGHTVQMETVLAAYEAWQDIAGQPAG